MAFLPIHTLCNLHCLLLMCNMEKNKQTKYTDPILIINLYFVQYINFLLHYLRQKVFVCPSLIASSLLKVLPRTSRGSGLQGPHSLLSEPAPFQVELLYNQCP